ncbi:basement membrane-specific heparan sulfate proteoglycan core protein isoform X7 [Bacillus rossius redtenbacheri]|uniref:basement membrane-specific heparan sulfate proteoglycan core protein isoform X7 n=1 Tax=Bacillus rossius redtenbacheri TaxID=93214 RepID=UPI002FDD61BF
MTGRSPDPPPIRTGRMFEERSEINRWMLCCLAVAVLAVSALPVTSSLEFDNDLVFDDPAANSELFPGAEQLGRSSHRRLNGSAEAGGGGTALPRAPPPAPQTVAPVQSPPERRRQPAPESPPPEPAGGLGILDSLRHIGHRAKRFLGLWGEDRRARRSADDDDDAGNALTSDLEEGDPPDGGEEEDLERQLGEQKQALKARRGDTQLDDEDYVNEAASGDFEGSAAAAGTTTTERSEQQRPSSESLFFRIKMIIGEPYRSSFADRDSKEFQQVARPLSEGIVNLYQNLPGRRSCSIIKIEPTSDSMQSRITLDLGTIGFTDREVIRQRLRDHIRNSRRIGPVTVPDENVDITEFSASTPRPGVPTPLCESGEMACRNGECVPYTSRCDGLAQCEDGSDELGCPASPTSSTPTSVELRPVGTSSSTLVSRCRADDQVRCADGRVSICKIQECDGQPDCPGGTDELNCPTTPPECREGEFVCDLDRCLPASMRCDNRVDCTDGTDEQNCPQIQTPQPPTEPTRPSCQSDQYQCRDGSCIDGTQVCDSYRDCPEGEDESSCDASCRPTFEWRCDSGTCIDARLRCNGRIDCPRDDSDERNCPAPCISGQFRCRDGSCIDAILRCDNKIDCPRDSLDEEYCPCTADQFECSNKHCIPRSRHCDGYNDCQDGSDERNCRRQCSSDEFLCGDNTTCISNALRCDRRVDCPDGSDEANCGVQPTCRTDEFRCEDGTCLNINQRCNGASDCLSGEDEEGCVVELFCHPWEWPCKDSVMCLSREKHCDGFPDCFDDSDEVGCEGVRECSRSEYRCRDGGCISDAYRCDGFSDCSDGSDEQNCSTEASTCRPEQFTCGNGECVDASRKCDGQFDCIDSSDERDCGVCTPEQFRCANGNCIPENQRCDSNPDCGDGSDELDCEPATCQLDEVRCGDGRCLSAAYHCDGYRDCNDGADEVNCSPKSCAPGEFTCADGDCIDDRRRCDRRRDCRDGSDEESCPEPQPTTCGPNYFTCQDGSCVGLRQRCDGRRDCRDGSDESLCRCRSDQFQCSSGECLSRSSRCNGYPECADSSDEANCPTPPPLPPQCPSGLVPCRTPGQCVPRSALCDGRIDCQDFSDEDNCGSSNQLNLKTYPDDQTIKESREVVFQCRDEGPLRARVHWTRENGLPLPPGSRNINGRLEMPDIQVEHSGTYLCEAVGVPYNVTGARSVPVHLSVEKEEFFTPRPQSCGYNEATCSNGQCISRQLVCDGREDCSDGSDEMRCNPIGCEPNEFRCNNKKCVLKTWMCDADDDCGDNSDEANCATNAPGSPCRYSEFQCRSGNQCIPKSFHCDQAPDCQDGSDEIGCSSAYIQSPPPPMITLDIGSIFIVTCTARGIPTPQIVWRLNWGHIPSKCTTTSVDGTGTLTCPDIQESDQGAYSCEAINVRGSTFAVPDTILVVNKPTTACPRGSFNDDASSESECISCFCFGVTTDCKSADLFTFQLPPPINVYRLVNVQLQPTPRIQPEPPFRSFQPTLSSLANGFRVFTSEAQFQPNNVLYFALPESYNGNQLKSYGGYLKYTVNYKGDGRPITAPDIIISGNGYILTHQGRNPSSRQDNDVSVRIFRGEWYKIASPEPRDTLNTPASREEIMMVLSNTDNILIRSQYTDGSVIDTSVFNILLDSAGIRNTGLGQAVYVEECRCPVGYTGLSCEQCAPGYNRRRSGPWLGLCTREPETCLPGYYGDPSRNVPCQPCPCPLTTPSNQFGRTCHLDTRGDVTCDCPPGYVGRRCEMCDVGYQGNPLIPGDTCSRGTCNVAGSLAAQPNPASGECECKNNVIGASCDRCKASTFFLDPSNQFGCISCFCMGVTSQCQSSSLYRDQVAVAFTRNTQDFKLVGTSSRLEPITDGIHVDLASRELVFQDFSRRPDVYYWQLPLQFLGDKLTSYGGQLKYTLRYVPVPGGQSSRNSAPDVELISTNGIRLLYFRREQIEPNQQQTISVPLLEQHWQRLDGQTADREHMLITLADLGMILIKATYTTNTREAALLSVSLDVAEERNTGQPRALAVEQCICPAGHVGLSCEDCDVGYTHKDAGLYLGLCEPCGCNGHSSECDPDTGVCRNCRDHTTGDSCELCETGYGGDATRGTPSDCQPRGVAPTCSCDPRGSLRSDCPDGVQCVCKTNVEGARCNRCRQGTFALSAENPEGCLECFCSGVTDICQASAYNRTQIPMQIIDTRHGFTLTDRSRSEVIREGFVLNVAQNEIGYSFPPSARGQRMFWSLPPSFSGNKVASYGGNLTVTQHYSARPSGQRDQDTDVIITGNGITLYWTYPGLAEPDQPFTFSVPLRESSWWRLDQSGRRTASRADLLTVLANVEAILVRATHSTQTLYTSLGDVSLDTAVPQYTGQRVAIEVEACRCPEGYRGTSCETCSPGYYRNRDDTLRGSVLGSCQRCPCNSHEESCQATPDGRVMCTCQTAYTGQYCESTKGLMMELVPIVVKKPIGSIVTFVCSYNSNDGMNIEFIEVPPSPTAISNGNTSLQHTHMISRYESGAKRLFTIKVHRNHHSVICVVSDKAGRIVGNFISRIYPVSVVEPPEEEYSTEGPTPRPPQPPTITVRKIDPEIQIVAVGTTARFRCSGQSIYQRPVSMEWSKEGGELPPERAIDDHRGLLVITDVRVSDSGTYVCHVTDGYSFAEERAVLSIGGSSATRPQATIEPRFLEVTEGEPAEFRCAGTGVPAPTLSWFLGGNRPLPPQATFSNGVFRISAVRKSDEGEYECHAVNPSGSTVQRTVLYVRAQQRPPAPLPGGSLSIQPPQFSGPTGETVTLTCRTASDQREYTVRWSRADGRSLPLSSAQRSNVLTIYNASPDDSGVYVCVATSIYSGEVTRTQARVTIVPYGRPPTVRIEPERQTIPQGTTGELRCAASGDPTPQVQWAKAGSDRLGFNIQVIGDLLRITDAQIGDRGVYVCTATSSAGSIQASAVIEVERREAPSLEMYPRGDRVVNVGGSFQLQCRIIKGIPAPTVQWRRPGGRPLPSGAEQLPGGVLRLTGITEADEGEYTCHAENEAGSVESVAVLTVQSRPQIRLSPSSRVEVNVGQRVRLECTATGKPQPSVSWSKVSDQYSYSSPGVSERLETAIFEITSARKEDGGIYRCTATNAAGDSEDRLQLVVNEDAVSGPPRGDIPGGGFDSDNQVNPGYGSGGSGYPTDSGRGSGRYPTDSGRGSGGYPTDSGRGSGGYPTDSGRGSGGYPTDSGRGTGGYPTDGGRQPGGYPPERWPGSGGYRPQSPGPRNEYTVPTGGRAELRCNVDGNRQRIYLNWVRADNGPMPDDHRISDGTLYINNVQPSAAGDYACIGYGENSEELFRTIARLVVHDVLRIDLYPKRQEVRPGANPYVRCTATGRQPISIEWTAEGRSMPASVNVNQGILQFRGIAVSDAGRYVCTARDADGGEAYAPAEVIVTEHSQSVVSAVQRDVSTFEGSSIQLRCTESSGYGRRARLTWRRDGQPLPSSAREEGDELVISDVQLADQGRYICEVQTPTGPSSDYINLRVEQYRDGYGCDLRATFRCNSGECISHALVCDTYDDCRDSSDEVDCRYRRQHGVSDIALRIEPSQQMIRLGDTVDLHCSSSGDSPTSFSWSKGEGRLGNNIQTSGSILRVESVNLDNGGVYTCTATTQDGGSFTADYILKIQDGMTGDAAAIETKTAPYGSTVIMDCDTDLEKPVAYSWSKQGGTLRAGATARSEKLTITDVRGQDAGTYVCTAQNENMKMDIPTVLVVTGVVPYFAQAPTSYMVFPTLPDGYLEFDITVSFKPESANGLILYNAEKKGKEGDFVSLGLNNSYVEYRFDVGRSPVLIRSSRPISLREWHTVKIDRKRREGRMYVDDDGPFTGKTLGRYQGLDLREPFYLGGVPSFDDIHQDNGFTSGFVGCISRLVIGADESDLVHDATLSQGVTTCETCAASPCQNHGVCQEATEPQGYTCICPPGFSGLNCDKVGETCFPGACGSGRCVNKDEGFLCYCPYGKIGDRCENNIDIIEPAFADDAYVAYPTPKALRRLKVTLKFKPETTDDGVLMYCAQSEDGNGDFTSLAIKDKKLEFKFDTGSGPAVVRSKRDVSAGEWLTVYATRNMRQGQLTVGNEAPVTGVSPGASGGLNLRIPLYVGGYDKERVRLSNGVGVTDSFRGCVAEVHVSNIKMDLKSSLVDSANVQECSRVADSPCNSGPCQNGALCRPDAAGLSYTCVCREGFSGRHCDKQSDLCKMLQPCKNGGSCIGTVNSYFCKCPIGYFGTNCHEVAEFTTEVSFRKNGYLELRKALLPHTSTKEKEIIIVEFSTSDPNGLIFWHGQKPETDGKGLDYLSLAVVNGHLEFSYELGSGPAQIQIGGGARVDDGKRHRVVLKRLDADGSMELDTDTSVFGQSKGQLTMLNTHGNIYVGGLPNFEHMTAGKYLEGFSGCIHSLQIQDSGEINLKESAVSAVNALPCSNTLDFSDNDVLNRLDGIVYK